MSLKIKYYWEQPGGLSANVSVFASVSVRSCIFVSVLLCFLLACELAAHRKTRAHLAFACVIYVRVSFAPAATDGPRCYCWNPRVPIMLQRQDKCGHYVIRPVCTSQPVCL